MKPSEREATLLSLSGEVLATIPAKGQLQKAVSEFKMAQRGCQDVLLGLLMQHKKILPFGQYVHCIPFKVAMWSNSMLRVYCEVAKLLVAPVCAWMPWVVL